jgi:zona occludens toxin (predicted ATPase)
VDVSPAEADYLLDEWGRWARDDWTGTGFKDRSPFYVPGGVLPAVLPVDVDRAYNTDRVVAKLQGRRRFVVRLHYLDPSPLQAKARRMRMRDEHYRALVKGICLVVGRMLDGTGRKAYTCEHAQGA